MPDPSQNSAPKPQNEPLPVTASFDTDSRRTQSTGIEVTRSSATPGNRSSAPSIAGYSITGEIGRGGMGQVYAGRDLTLKREVAIKTLLPGANAERFIVESQITAQLPHPGIPPVHALGTLADGTPYLAMKLIRGRTLAQLLKDRASPQADLSRFLQIFEQVAQAVGFAHARGIIHRDLKPANIMVGAFGEVQVMDWGLAKELRSAEQGLGTEKTSADLVPDPTLRTPQSTLDLSHTGSIFGTPGYMSPEQARGERVDARTDVFALGSILATILTGQPAFVGMKAAEIVERTAAADLSDVVSRLDASVADEELTTLAKSYLTAEPVQRAANAQVIATDIAAYRAGVEERLRRAETQAAEALVREAEGRKRKNVWLALAAVFFIGVIISSALAYFTNEARKDANLARAAEAKRADSENEARIEEKRAKEQTARRLEQIEKGSEIFHAIFDDIDIRNVREGTEPLEAVLAKRLVEAGEQLQGDSIGDPFVVAKLQNRLGVSLLGLGYPEPAIRLFEAARSTFQDVLDADHVDVLDAMGNLAVALKDAGRIELSLPLFEDTLRRRQAKFGPDHPGTLEAAGNLAHGYEAAGKLDRALPLFEEVFERQSSRLGVDNPNIVSAMNNLAACYLSAGKLELAVSLHERALKICKENLGPDHHVTLNCTGNLAAAYESVARIDEAVALYDESFQLRKRKLGRDHPSTLLSMNNLAIGYSTAGRLEQALPLLEETLVLTKMRLGTGHPRTYALMHNLANAYRNQGKLAQAISLHEEVLKLQKVSPGINHPDTMISQGNLAEAYRLAGELNLALPLYLETLKLQNANLGPEHPATLITMHNLALAYRAAGRNELALPVLEKALALKKLNPGPNHPSSIATMKILGLAYHDGGQADRAISLLEETVRLSKEHLGSKNRETLNAMNCLAWSLYAVQQFDRAIPMYEETLRLQRANLGADDVDTITTMNNLGEGHRAAGNPKLAIPILKETLKLRLSKFGPDHLDTITTVGNLAAAYSQIGDGMLAASHHRDFISGLRKRAANQSFFAVCLASSATDLVRCGQFAFAEELLREALSIREKLEPNSWTNFQTQLLLGEALLGQHKTEEAELLLQFGFEGLQERDNSIPLRDRKQISEAIDRLIKLYTALDEPDEVKKWRTEREKYPAQESSK